MTAILLYSYLIYTAAIALPWLRSYFGGYSITYCVVLEIYIYLVIDDCLIIKKISRCYQCYPQKSWDHSCGVYTMWHEKTLNTNHKANVYELVTINFFKHFYLNHPIRLQLCTHKIVTICSRYCSSNSNIHLDYDLHSPLANDGPIKWKHFPSYWPFVRGRYFL